MHISATAFGGGVSEILYTLVPLMRDVGLHGEWQVIYGREEFFTGTKLMHNALQGAPQDLDAEQWDTWHRYNEMNARELSQRVERRASSTIRSPPRCSGWSPRRRRPGCGAVTSISLRRTPTRSPTCCPTSPTTPTRCFTCAITCPPG